MTFWCSNLNAEWTAPSENVSSSMRKMRRFGSSCACAKYHLRLCSQFIHFTVSNDSVSGQWRPWSDCADAQADLGLRRPHMSKDTLLRGAVLMGIAQRAHSVLPNHCCWLCCSCNVCEKAVRNYQHLHIFNRSSNPGFVGNSVQKKAILLPGYRIYPKYLDTLMLYRTQCLTILNALPYGGGGMWRWSRVSYTGASNWYRLTAGQGLLILVAGKGRGGNVFISSVSSLSFLLFSLPCPSLSSFLLSHLFLFSLSLGDDTKWHTRVDVSLNPNTTNQCLTILCCLKTCTPTCCYVWNNVFQAETVSSHLHFHCTL